MSENAGPPLISPRPTRQRFSARSPAKRRLSVPSPAAERLGDHLKKGLGLSRRSGHRRTPLPRLPSGRELSGGVCSPLRKRTVPYAYLRLFACSAQLTRGWRLTRGTRALEE